jgi:hypothetical protein
MTRDVSLVARAEAFVNVPVPLSHMATSANTMKRSKITISDSANVVLSSHRLKYGEIMKCKPALQMFSFMCLFASDRLR